MQDLGLLIPLTAIAGGLSIPVTAILMEARRNRLMFEERRAMVEKGLMPPPLSDEPYGRERKREGRALLESSLHSGMILLFLGVGLTLGFVLLQFVLDPAASVVPHRIVPLLGVVGSIVTLLGIGHLAYFAVARRRTPPVV